MEKGITIEYTLRQVNHTPINKDYVASWLQKVQKVAKSNITLARSIAKCPPNPYLGVVLFFTHIAYCALVDALDQLPAPWDVPPGAAMENKSLPKPQSQSTQAKAEKKKVEKKRKREEKEKTTSRTTWAKAKERESRTL